MRAHCRSTISKNGCDEKAYAHSRTIEYMYCRKNHPLYNVYLDSIKPVIYLSRKIGRKMVNKVWIGPEAEFYRDATLIKCISICVDGRNADVSRGWPSQTEGPLYSNSEAIQSTIRLMRVWPKWSFAHEI